MQHSDGIEIERKFLLRGFPAHLEKRDGVLMKQGYLSCEIAHVEVRIRSAGDNCFLTVKKGRGMLRREEEILISGKQFERFWPFTEGARLLKTRYRVTDKNVVVEIDEYHEKLSPLIVAEIELPPGADFLKIDLPGWIGTEITGVPEYTNQHLTRHGLPDEFIKATPLPESDATRPITHAGAIPYKIREGKLQILCVTSRISKKWIVPKGVWDAGCDLDEVAEKEAREEAGVTGNLDGKALGIYEEAIDGRNDRVELFGLEVTKLEESWPETDLRERRWFDFDEALTTVSYPGIALLLRKLYVRVLD